jgi:hypothetical protein
MQLLNSGYKRLKVLIHVFHSLDWFQILWYVHNVFIVTFYKKYFIYLFIIIIILQSKVQKIKYW